eukprot:3705260-Rhodomonas_salina.2
MPFGLQGHPVLQLMMNHHLCKYLGVFIQRIPKRTTSSTLLKSFRDFKTTQTVNMDPKKTEAVQDWPQALPATVWEALSSSS